ncbi:cation:proton antiporter [Rubrivirga litoralis]|uniref:Cation:proton antiporter n=1 Tax=Rubrivirga litoralis TaxID=3075598 RepID=A0ABU3BTU3_9BACT|nr:cation:proton antiporter [Rubrivirga sp. F394]MDT0632713.1 cation:proton antiporter [Rubrivirga sp. F394]
MPFVLAAGAVPPFLVEVVAIVMAAAVVAYVSQRLGLVPIVGFLLAGVLIGPSGLRLVRDPELIDAAAEVGVLLLLFTIGIEFSLDKLARIKRLIFVGGGVQVGLTTALVAGLCLAFGVGWRPAVFTGFLVALSSTAIVTKLLGDRGETGTDAGQGAVGLLIFQDLAVILMVLLVPALGGGDVTGGELAIALGTAAAIIVFVLVVARRLLPPLLEHVARTCSPELFLLTIIAICFGTAYAVGLAGVSISLGAFLAGLVVSQSRFSEHALSEILPLQILFSATFFVSVGLLLDVGFFVRNLGLVLGALVAVVAIKLLTTFVAVRVVGRATPVAAASALWLAQVGEFSFVLERSGREVGLTPLGMDGVGAPLFIAATVVSMALTPLAAPWAGRLAGRLRERGAGRDAAATPPPDPEAFADLENHVIVAGYGAAARRLVHVLDGSGIPFAIVTLSPDGAREAEAEGRRVLRGDYAKRHILGTVGLDRAKMMVVPDDTPGMTHRVVSVARALSPTVRIVATATTMEEAEELVEAGADRAIATDLEAVLGLFDDVLRRYQVEPAEILRHEEALRRGSYQAFDGGVMDRPSVRCELDDDCFSTRTVTIREGAAAAGKTLADLDLDRRLLHAVQIDRAGETLREPGGAAALAPGDVVLFGGTPQAFVDAADLFRTSDASAPAPPDLPAMPAQTAPWIDTSAPVHLDADPDAGCTHLDHVHDVTPGTQGCQECLEAGDRWVHLRVCMECGHVGCCDSSPNKHATEHYHATGHPVARSIEPSETWGWCYEDEVML